MMVKGITPDEISKHFGIAISSVHNYKRQLKESGISIPDIRGKRPSDKDGSKAVEPFGSPISVSGSDGFTITINGVSVYVSNAVKQVSIGPNGISVSI